MKAMEGKMFGMTSATYWDTYAGLRKLLDDNRLNVKFWNACSAV